MEETNNPINDSIQKYLELGGDESIDIGLRNKYNNKVLSMIDLNKNDRLTRQVIYKTIVNLSNLNSNGLMENLSKTLISKSSEARDSISLYNGYNCLGYYYMIESKNELAVKYFFKAKKGFSSINLIEDELNMMFNIANTQSYANDFLGSIKTSCDIIRIAKVKNLRYRINSCYMLIGNNLSYLKDNLKAIEYYKQIVYDENMPDNIFSLNGNIASSYIQLANYEQAFFYLKKNVDNANFKKMKTKNIAVTYSLLGLYYLKQQQPEQAIIHLKKADNIFKSINPLNGENYNYIYLSDYYSQVKDSENSINAAKKAISLSKTYNNPSDVLLSLQQMIKVNKKEASIYAQYYMRVNDSLQIAERNFRDNFARIQFETDEITIQKETAVKHKWIIFSISVILILIVMLLFVISRQRNKQREMLLMQKQQKSNEDIYHLMLTQKEKEENAIQMEKSRIARELHDNIMNKLSSTRLSLSILSLNTNHETIQKCLAQIHNLSLIESEIRNVSHNLNQDAFQKRDSFVKMLKDFMDQQNDIGKTHFELQIDRSINWNVISSEIKMNLFRIIQEAINNINKHAKAKSASVNFILDESNICLSIVDDGIGFDVYLMYKGIGIENIKSRVDLLNGKLSINSAQGNTSINIAIPFYSTFC